MPVAGTTGGLADGREGTDVQTEVPLTDAAGVVATGVP